MANKRFFNNKGPFTVKQILEVSGARLSKGDDSKLVEDVSSLNAAEDSHISFLENKKYLNDLAETKAGVCIIREEEQSRVPEGVIALFSDNPALSFAKVAHLFYPEMNKEPFIHETATIHESAQIDPSCYIGPGAIIEANVTIGAKAEIDANTFIGEGCSIGQMSKISPLCRITHSKIGNQVFISSGAVIGQLDSCQDGDLLKTKVSICDYVEIGSNTVINLDHERDTIIGQGTIIDNLVYVGGGTQTGNQCILVSFSSIAKNATLGHGVVLAGQSAIAEAVNVGNACQLTARAGVTEDVGDNLILAGMPAMDAKEFIREQAFIRRLIQKRGRAA